MLYWWRSRAWFFAKHYGDITHYAVHFLITSATVIRFDCFNIGVGLRGSCVLIDDVLVCAVHIKHCRPLFSHSCFFDSSAPAFGLKVLLTHSGEKPVKIDTEIRMEVSVGEQG